MPNASESALKGSLKVLFQQDWESVQFIVKTFMPAFARLWNHGIGLGHPLAASEY